MGETGRYMYAITRGLTAEDLRGIHGLADQGLDVVDQDGLVAVVSTVDLAEYGEDGLRRNLEDIEWLERVARAHDTVVHAVASHGPTAPLRLATICLGDDQVRARLDQWGDRLVRALDRVTDRMEWSVKAFAPQQSEPAAEPPAAGTTAGAGTAYLQRRKADAARRQHAAEDATELADQLHAALSGHAVASRRLPPQDRRLTGHERTMILNGAYLVDDGLADDFRRRAEELARNHPGSGVDVQGPWPPYSFATLDES